MRVEEDVVELRVAHAAEIAVTAQAAHVRETLAEGRDVRVRRDSAGNVSHRVIEIEQAGVDESAESIAVIVLVMEKTQDWKSSGSGLPVDWVDAEGFVRDDHAVPGDESDERLLRIVAHARQTASMRRFASSLTPASAGRAFPCNTGAA